MSDDPPALVSKVWGMAHVLCDLLNEAPAFLSQWHWATPATLAGDEPEAPWPSSVS